MAQSSKGQQPPEYIELEYKQNSEKPIILRAPVHGKIEVCYYMSNQILTINQNGAGVGEVYLYLNGIVIDYSSEINSIFQISSPGLYEIEIVGESWTAYGYLQL
ncbi:MAG: hypothetical protein K2M10_05370 [Muribaculaceae bacterium]|nr:hypothetical protein [Muribaculaceae bacterium]